MKKLTDKDMCIFWQRRVKGIKTKSPISRAKALSASDEYFVRPMN